MAAFLLDLWEIVACTYCGAGAGEVCTTRTGRPTTKSHSPRVCWVD